MAGQLRAAYRRLFLGGSRAATATARAHRVREDVEKPELDPLDLLPPQAQDLVRQLLDRFVRPQDHGMIGTDTDKRMPDALASLLASGVALGHTQTELAKAIRPHLEGSRVRRGGRLELLGCTSRTRGRSPRGASPSAPTSPASPSTPPSTRTPAPNTGAGRHQLLLRAGAGAEADERVPAAAVGERREGGV